VAVAIALRRRRPDRLPRSRAVCKKRVCGRDDIAARTRRIT
jgi:hypothetical protein